MSETLKKQAKRTVFKSFRTLAPLAVVLTFGAAETTGEGLQAYGARMCADVGILPENCSFVTDPIAVRQAEIVREERPDGSADKTATLLEHGRRVCEQENVPLEDCQVLPSAYRAEQAPAAAFLTVPSTLPPVDPALVPADPPPKPVVRRVVREPQPPVPPPAHPIPAAPVLAGEPDIRYLYPPIAAHDYRYAPAGGPDVRYLHPPVAAPDYHYAPAAAPAPALPVEPAYRWVEEPGVIHEPEVVIIERERPARLFQEERFRREERFVRDERVFLEERSGRCLRVVRYSAPPSYRYITC